MDKTWQRMYEAAKKVQGFRQISDHFDWAKDAEDKKKNK